MMEIFGKIRMPKALSSDTSTAATKAPMMLPRPPITTTTNTSTMIRRSMAWLTASRGICSAPPKRGEEDAERKYAREQPFLIDAERRHHVAVLRRRAHQHAPARTLEQQPEDAEHDGTERDQEEIVARHVLAEEIDRALKPGARRPSRSLGPQIRTTRSSTISVRPKVASSWNSSGA